MSSIDPRYAPEHPRNVIPELCRIFYNNGWVTGTGGGISIKHECVCSFWSHAQADNPSRAAQVFPRFCAGPCTMSQQSLIFICLVALL